VRWRALLLLAALFTCTGPVLGAYECLPGPAPGGASDWAWDASRGSAGRHRFSTCLSLGRPAAASGLAWSHMRVRGFWRPWSLAPEVYVLGLEDIYREALAGLWGGWRELSVGVRRWQASWSDGTRRGGWTLSGCARMHRKGIDLELAAQDIAFRPREASAPRPRFGLTVALRGDENLSFSAGAFRADTEGGMLLRVRWSPWPGVAVHEQLGLPGNDLRSGLEMCAHRARVLLWLDPYLEVGPRVGIACSLD